MVLDESSLEQVPDIIGRIKATVFGYIAPSYPKFLHLLFERKFFTSEL